MTNYNVIGGVVLNKLQNMIEPENIEDVEYSDIMGTSYTNYAMSVIISRAVPDVRDGLKPVQRRIIYDMGELGTRHDKPHRKSARITGDTMGKYHPHGDSAIYEALVVLAQGWKKNQPLVDGHGNFGSIEGDGAAAQRYTEARLQEFSEKVFLEDLNYDTVNMVPNYDETEKEPEVLPCKVPNLLINGSEGIAVGMTTSIPSHNLKDVINCAIAYLNGITDIKKLIDILQGPDFPTGGIVTNKHELENAYSTGNGKVRIRGKMIFEPSSNGERDRLVVTEIPFTMIGEGITKFLHDVAKLVEDKVLPEIYDIINESKNDDIRIVFELRPKSDIERIKNIICKKTKFEDTLGINMLVVDRGVPRVMNLLNILKSFSDFQEEIYTRKYQKLLGQAQHKKEITEGLIKATELIDVIIAVFRGSKTQAQVKKCLMTGDTTEIKFKDSEFKKLASTLSFTADQTNAIIDMRLSKLIGLETEAMKNEYDKICKEISTYEELLSDPKVLKKDIIKYLKDISKAYGRDRRTEVTDIETPDIEEIQTPEVELMVLIDKFNYIHAIDRSNYGRNKQYIDENFIYAVDISSRDKLAVFTDIGKVHMIPMKELPVKKPRDKGVPLDTICQFDYKIEHVVGVEALGFKKEEKLFVFVMSSGSVKLTKNSEFFINRKITDSTILRDNEKVFKVWMYTKGGSIILESSKGLILKESQDNIKIKSKYSMGMQGIKLNDKDTLKIATADPFKYTDVKSGKFGTAGKIRMKKLI